MIDQTSYWLGKAHTLLTQAREHMIRRSDVDGVELIENGFIELEKGMADMIKERVDGTK